MKKETARLILYNSKKLADGSYPIMIYFNDGKPRRVSTGEAVKQDRWDEKKGKVIDHYQADQINDTIRKKLEEAETILKRLRNENTYSWETFKSRCASQVSETTFFEFVDDLVKEMQSNNEIGNSKKYIQTKQMFRNFYGEDVLLFASINKDLLTQFEKWLKEKQRKGNTIHFYFSTLRAICNKARERGFMQKNVFYHSWYNREGFDFRGYSETVEPRTMTAVEVEAYKEFNIDDYPQYKRSYLRYLFMYAARGLSFVDMANIKWSHIRTDTIDYSRQKLKKKQKPIERSTIVNFVIDQFPKESEYVFGIHDVKITDPVKRYNRVVHQRRTFNKHIKEIGKLLGTKETLTSYVARYSFANVILEKGADVRDLQNALGHQNISTTERYVATKSNQRMRELQEMA